MRRGSFTFFSAFTFTALSVAAAIAGVVILVLESLPVWKHSGFSFITGETWFFRQEQFWAAAMIYGSLIVAFITIIFAAPLGICLLYTSPSPRDGLLSRMPSSA